METNKEKVQKIVIELDKQFGEVIPIDEIVDMVEGLSKEEVLKSLKAL